jgi:hypothetical protein
MKCTIGILNFIRMKTVTNYVTLHHPNIVVPQNSEEVNHKLRNAFLGKYIFTLVRS